MEFKVLIILCAIAIVLGGCQGEDEGEGTLVVELFGEEFIEDGIPSGEFDDGYSVHFDKFLVNLGKISVSGPGAVPELAEPDMKIWDLVRQGPSPIALKIVSAGELDHTRYTIAKSNGNSGRGNVSEADVQLMVSAGFSVYVDGQATFGSEIKSFRWGFDTETDYGPCPIATRVKDGETAAVQITIHGDHLFYDDAVGQNPSLRFSDISLADTDGNDVVSREELADYDITRLPNYGVGNLDIDNLWDFISHMTTTLGHINGEGHCD